MQQESLYLLDVSPVDASGRHQWSAPPVRRTNDGGASLSFLRIRDAEMRVSAAVSGVPAELAVQGPRVETTPNAFFDMHH